RRVPAVARPLPAAPRWLGPRGREREGRGASLLCLPGSLIQDVYPPAEALGERVEGQHVRPRGGIGHRHVAVRHPGDGYEMTELRGVATALQVATASQVGGERR